MNVRSATLRDYLALARMSNLPTCVSNVLVGLAIASTVAAPTAAPATRMGPPPSELQTLSGLLTHGGWAVLAAVCLLYTAGMVFNDYADRAVDQVERPGRPIPSGRVSPRTAMVLAIALSLAALGLLAASGEPRVLLWGAAMGAMIVAYDVLHRRFAWSALLMGACRALVYLTAAATSHAAHEAVWWRWVLPLAMILGLYTVGIALMARMENEARIGVRRWAAMAMPVLVLAGGLATVSRQANPYAVIIAAAVLLGWLSRASRLVFAQPPHTKQAVLTWISGMCLVDAYFLALLGWPMTAVIAGACFVLTVWGHRRIMGT